MSYSKALDDLVIGQIVALLEVNYTIPEIISRVPLATKNQVRNIKVKWQNGESLACRPGSGRKRKTTERQDRSIINAIKKNRNITIGEIKRECGLEHISESTICRRISQLSELKSYWKSLKPFVNAKQRKRRVDWCKAHRHWTVEQWRRVIWSDESPFTLSYNRRTRVWRCAHEKWKPFALRGTLKHDQKINVWGCFAAHGVGNICRIEGIMVKEMYRDILMHELSPSVLKLFPRVDNVAPQYMFQQDNDPKHTAKLVKDFIADWEIPMLDNWPGQSPDLNPIENLWSTLNESIKDRSCSNLEELFEVIKTGWEKLPVDILTTLADSMPNRIEAVIRNKGYPTKY